MGCGLQACPWTGDTEHLIDTNDWGSSRQIIYKPFRLRSVNLKQHMTAASYKSYCWGLGDLSVASAACNCQLWSQTASKVDYSTEVGRGKWSPRSPCIVLSCQLHEAEAPNTFLEYFRHNHVAEIQGFKNTLVSNETWVARIGFIKSVFRITFSEQLIFEIIFKATSSIYPWPTLWSIISLLKIDVGKVRRDSCQKINKRLKTELKKLWI